MRHLSTAAASVLKATATESLRSLVLAITLAVYPVEARESVCEYLANGCHRSLAGNLLWIYDVGTNPGFGDASFTYVGEHGMNFQPLQWTFLKGTTNVVWSESAHVWFPDRIDATFQGAGLRLIESKFVTWQDQAVVCMQISNRTQQAAGIEYAVDLRIANGTLASTDACLCVSGALPLAAVTHYWSVALSPADTIVYGSADIARNPTRQGYPCPSASHTSPYDNLWSALDGDPTTRWTCYGSGATSDWFAVEWNSTQTVERVLAFFYDDSATWSNVLPPISFSVQRWNGAGFADIPNAIKTPATPVGGQNIVSFDAVGTSKLRIVLRHHSGKYTGLTALEVHARASQEVRKVGGHLRVAGGACATLKACFAVHRVAAKAGELAQASVAALNPAADRRAEYDRWFDRNVPSFDCPDPYVRKMYYYRAFLIRYNMIDPQFGFYMHSALNEAKVPAGWWVAQVTTFPGAWQIMEARWMRDERGPALGHALNYIANQADDGRWGEGSALHIEHENYEQWLPWGMWQLYLVHPDADFLRQAAAASAKNVDFVSGTDADGDGLPTSPQSWYAGMEYAPSFFYFTEPRWNHASLGAPVERPARAAYLYLSCRALAGMRRQLGDVTGAEAYAVKAEAVQNAVTTRLWNEHDQFFYSVHPTTKLMAPVREVVGFCPFWAGLADERHVGMFQSLTLSGCFGTTWPVPTCDRSSIAYAPDDRWVADGSIYHYPSCWNGPVWPFTQGFVAGALADAIQRLGMKSLASIYRNFFGRYTRMMFAGQDISCPDTTEEYSPETGQSLSSCHHYFHSVYIDLVVSQVCGLMPSAEPQVVIRPIDMGWDHFKLDRLRYRGHDLAVVWDRTGAFYGMGCGLSVWADGRKVAATAELGPVEFPLAARPQREGMFLRFSP